MKRLLAWPLVLALVVPSVVAAEETTEGDQILVGSKVRLLAPTIAGRRLEGIVSQIDDESLLLLQENHPWRVSRRAITRLEVSTGSHRNVAKGAIIGGGIGAAFLTIAAASWGGGGRSTTAGDLASAMGIGLTGGALWGAGIGAIVKGNHWSTVPPERLHLSLAPVRGHGAGLTASIGWR